jgi:RHS repeat-associated protein
MKIFKSFTKQLTACLLILFAINAHAVRTTTYYHTDGLGSVVAASDESGNLLWRKSYAPYGEQIDGNTDNEPVSYTGKKHDDATGLTYFGARYYDPRIGRFMATDPVHFMESNPVSFNRYAYVNNNPYKYVDPDGNIPILVPLFFIFGTGSALTYSDYANAPGPNDQIHVKDPLEKALVTVGLPVVGNAAKGLAITKPAVFLNRTIRFRHGELFQHTIDTKKGPVDFLAETMIDGDTLHLKDVAIFGRKGNEALTGLQKEIFRGASELKEFAREQGFKRLKITGKRSEQSSSKRPGHDVDIGWDL